MEAEAGDHLAVEVRLIVLHVEVDLLAAHEAAAVVVVQLLDAEHVLHLVDGQQVHEVRVIQLLTARVHNAQSRVAERGARHHAHGLLDTRRPTNSG